MTLKLACQCLPCQAPGVVGLDLGLGDLVSVYCDYVRSKVVFSTSVSVWQHIQLSEQNSL